MRRVVLAVTIWALAILLTRYFTPDLMVAGQLAVTLLTAILVGVTWNYAEETSRLRHLTSRQLELLERDQRLENPRLVAAPLPRLIPADPATLTTLFYDVDPRTYGFEIINSGRVDAREVKLTVLWVRHGFSTKSRGVVRTDYENQPVPLPVFAVIRPGDVIPVWMPQCYNVDGRAPHRAKAVVRGTYLGPDDEVHEFAADVAVGDYVAAAGRARVFDPRR